MRKALRHNSVQHPRQTQEVVHAVGCTKRQCLKSIYLNSISFTVVYTEVGKLKMILRDGTCLCTLQADRLSQERATATHGATHIGRLFDSSGKGVNQMQIDLVMRNATVVGTTYRKIGNHPAALSQSKPPRYCSSRLKSGAVERALRPTTLNLFTGFSQETSASCCKIHCDQARLELLVGNVCFVDLTCKRGPIFQN